MEDVKTIVNELSGVNIASLPIDKLRYFYKAIYKIDMPECSACREDSINSIKKWLQGNSDAIVQTHSKYRFKKEHEDKEVILLIDGNRLIINKYNITDSSAKRAIERNFGHLLEENPDFDPNKKKVAPVSLSTSTTSTLQPVPSAENNLSQQQTKPVSQPNDTKQNKGIEAK